MRYSVNLSTVFTEVPFLERFQKAKEAGFQFVECQFPYDYPIQQVKEELEKNNLSLELINLPPGNWNNGDRGLSVDPNRADEFQASIESGIAYATALNVKKIHCMAGIIPPQLDKEVAKRTFINNVREAGEKFAQLGLTLLIEPINSFDMPGYFLSDLEQADKLIDKIGLSNVKLQYDFYHIQRMHGNLINNFQKYLSKIGHVQLADTPGRHEPGTGEIHYENVLKAVEQSDYKGLIGLEYTPEGKSEDSFTWISQQERGLQK